MDWFSWLSKSNIHEPSLVYEYGNTFARNELEEEDIPYFNHEFLQSMGICIAKHRLEILKLAKKENEGKVTPHDHSMSRLVLKFNKAKRSIAKRISKLISRGDATIKALPETAWHQDKWRGDLLRRHMSEKEHKDNRMIVQKHMRATLSGPLDARMMQEKRDVHNLLPVLSLNEDKKRVDHPNRGLKLSGPLDSRVHNGMIYTNRSPRVSGKVGRVQDKGMFVNRSPRRASGTWDGKLVSPKTCSQQNKNKEIMDGTHGEDGGDDDDDDGEENHSLWTVLFQDMKPT